jgi:hypothetical protein
MKTTKLLGITGDYKELKEKLLGLTKNNYSWSIEYENDDIMDMVTLTLTDFSLEEKDDKDSYIHAKAIFEHTYSKHYIREEKIYINLYNYDFTSNGTLDVEVKDNQIFLALYTLFVEIGIL